MKHLSIDIETYSALDITKTGAYKYANDPSFTILLFAYRYDSGPVQVVDLASGEQIPETVLDDLYSSSTTKHAYNAAFEMHCLDVGIHGPKGRHIDPEQWQCTRIHGLYLSLPGSLEAVGEALELPEDKKKATIGKALIKYFCKPCEPTRSNGNRTRNLPHHDPDKWALFKEYNRQDVETESTIEHILAAIPVPETEWQRWRADYKMNRHGVLMDTQLIDGALEVYNEEQQELVAEAQRITGLKNPNSAQQLIKWLNARIPEPLEDLTKATVEKAIAKITDPDIVRILRIRQEISKTSIKKYQAAKEVVDTDSRAKGLIQFYGSRTGRWAGRLIQVQNLPRTYIDSLDLARELVKEKNKDGIKLIYGSIPNTLSQLIRTAFIPAAGKKLAVADFSAIEARVIAWIAGETWRQEVFATHGKIYEASAAAMFGVPIDSIAKGHENYHLRAKGKIAELALGYQGAVGALKAMGAVDMGIPEEELPEIVAKWRKANSHIVELWHTLDDMLHETTEDGIPCHIPYISMQREHAGNLDYLSITLPSGRKIYYYQPQILTDGQGREHFTYRGVNQTTRKWERTEAYGGKITENIVQAIARDCLATFLDRLSELDATVLFHVHDEVIVESADPDILDKMLRIMREPIPWAPGLILKGDGFTGNYYRKE